METVMRLVRSLLPFFNKFSHIILTIFVKLEAMLFIKSLRFQWNITVLRYPVTYSFIHLSKNEIHLYTL